MINELEYQSCHHAGEFVLLSLPQPRRELLWKKNTAKKPNFGSSCRTHVNQGSKEQGGTKVQAVRTTARLAPRFSSEKTNLPVLHLGEPGVWKV